MKTIIFLFVTIVFVSYDSINEEAIKVCQKTKDATVYNIFVVEYGQTGIAANATWLDFANLVANKNSDKKYEWKAKNTDEIGILLVSFTDEKGQGYFWEVNPVQQIVKYINNNDFLLKKYSKYCKKD
jgi:hypothetical protein